VTRSVRIHP